MPKRLSVVEADRCVGCQCCMFACARRLGQGGLGASCIGVRSAGGIRKGFTVVVCRACPDPPCARVCPTDALRPRPSTSSGQPHATPAESAGGAGAAAGVRLDPALCIGCGNCVQACPFGAIFWDERQAKPLVCVYCGYCAPYCPYDVLAHEEVENMALLPGPPGAAAAEVAHGEE